MSIRIATTLALVALLTSCSAATSRNAAANDDLAADEAALRPMLAELLAAANAHDTDRHLALYLQSPELVFVVNDEPIRGIDSLRVRQRQWWQDGKSDVVYEIVGAPAYRSPAPGVVIQTYFLKAVRSVAGTPPRTSSFGITAVWQHRPEGWRIIYAHEAVVTR